MDPSWLVQARDWVIFIFGIFATLAAITVIAVALLVFLKLAPILDSAKGTLSNIRGTSSFVSGLVVKPIIQVVSFATGAQRTVGIITRLSRITRRKGDTRHG